MYDCSHKFTGKERDTESGLDEFGARYYGSSLGRFMTPDWAAKPITVPYANFGNPQSLNLYSYVTNNPLTLLDDDGHDIIYAAGLQNAQLVKDSVQAILANPNTSANLSGYVGKDNPNLTIQSGDLSAGDTRTVSPDGQTVTTTTVQGNTAPDIQTTQFNNDPPAGGPGFELPAPTLKRVPHPFACWASRDDVVCAKGWEARTATHKAGGPGFELPTPTLKRVPHPFACWVSRADGVLCERVGGTDRNAQAKPKTYASEIPTLAKNARMGHPLSW